MGWIFRTRIVLWDTQPWQLRKLPDNTYLCFVGRLLNYWPVFSITCDAGINFHALEYIWPPTKFCIHAQFSGAHAPKRMTIDPWQKEQFSQPCTDKKLPEYIMMIIQSTQKVIRDVLLWMMRCLFHFEFHSDVWQVRWAFQLGSSWNRDQQLCYILHLTSGIPKMQI